MVSINRVTKVVKGGKNLSFSALVVVGDGHGVVGYGVGKAKEVPSAIKKGIEAAKKNLIRVPLQGHDDAASRWSGASAPGACCSSRRRKAPASSPAARCARWSNRRRLQRADQVARHRQPPQRGARGVHGAAAVEGSQRSWRACAARTRTRFSDARGRRTTIMAEQAKKTAEDHAGAEPDRVQPDPGGDRPGDGAAQDPPHGGTGSTRPRPGA